MIGELLDRISIYEKRIQDFYHRSLEQTLNDEVDDEYECEEFTEDEEYNYEYPVIPDEINFDETAEIIFGDRVWKPETMANKPIRYTVSPANQWYFEIDGVVFSKETGLLVLFPPGKTDVYAIPDDVRVTGIGKYAFYGNHLIREIIWNNRVRYIAEGAFADCTVLQELTIPSSVEYVGQYAFNGCTSLKKVTIQSRISRISKGMFSKNYSLESVRYPTEIEGIDGFAFADCKSLREVKPLDENNENYDVILPPGINSIGRETFSVAATAS